MANTMFKNNEGKSGGNIMQRFKAFAKDINSSGRNPEDILKELVDSGKVSKQQLDNAVKMAKQYEPLLKNL